MVKLTFNPGTVEDTNTHRLFKFGGAACRFWLLWKVGHVTDQTFTPMCVLMAHELEKLKTYNFDQFINLIRQGPAKNGTMGHDYKEWIIKHWDYFNPNIQKHVTIEYEVQEIVKKEGRI